MNDSIVKKIEYGNILEEKGKKREALNIYLDVFNEIKDGGNKNGELKWVIACIYLIYFEFENYKEAKKWVLKLFDIHIPSYSTQELIDLGVVCYEMKEKEESFDAFFKAYNIGGKRAFERCGSKYFSFFKKGLKNRK